jgi:hypothetical protein
VEKMEEMIVEVDGERYLIRKGDKFDLGLDWIEVIEVSPQEIKYCGLDEDGRIDSLPVSEEPQMFVRVALAFGNKLRLVAEE